MVGIEIFREHFKDFRECYIVIGGVACEDHFEGEGIAFRSTKDIDLVLVVKALSNEFIAHFWEFIKQGNYKQKQIGEGKRQYYRFINPVTEHFPMQIELFSRTPDVITRTDGMTLTPIPVDEELSSLSAILMDNEYYEFTVRHSQKGATIHRADDLALICLKAKAFLDLTEKKAEGKTVDSRNIGKHKNDVFRLAATLRADDRIELPEGIKNDLNDFVQIMSDSTPDVKAIMKAMGVNSVTAVDLINQIKHNFKL